MDIKNTKPMYVGVDEVCADWGVSRSKGYAIIKQLSDQMKAEKFIWTFVLINSKK